MIEHVTLPVGVFNVMEIARRVGTEATDDLIERSVEIRHVHVSPPR
jgi:hypothetical protein